MILEIITLLFLEYYILFSLFIKNKISNWYINKYMYYAHIFVILSILPYFPTFWIYM
jgi:hypothetical protein